MWNNKDFFFFIFRNKTLHDCKTLPLFHLIGCCGVKLFLPVLSPFELEFCHNLSFCYLGSYVVMISVDELCHNLIFWVFSIWFLRCHIFSLSFWVLTIWFILVFHNLNFWVVTFRFLWDLLPFNFFFYNFSCLVLSQFELEFFCCKIFIF